MKTIWRILFGALMLAALATGPVRADEPTTGGRFMLKNHLGQIVTDSNFANGYMLILFGYTFCPDICPTGLQVMAEVMDKLGKDGERIQPLFITVDPERDTEKVLAAYVKAFHPRIMGLTGPKIMIESVTKKYRVKYAKVEDKPGDPDYTMDHTAAMFFMGPKSKYLARFPYGTEADVIVRKIREIIGAKK